MTAAKIPVVTPTLTFTEQNNTIDHKGLNIAEDKLILNKVSIVIVLSAIDDKTCTQLHDQKKAGKTIVVFISPEE
jgi:hypothetical protein